jgi:outer membrane protein assembly factor BamA
MKRVFFLPLLAVLTLLPPLQGFAQVVVLDRGMTIDEKRTGWLPYIFATDSLGTALGAAAFASGNFQPQSSIFGAAFVTSNESALLSGALNNIQFGDSRWFFDAFLLADHFTDQRFYGDYDNDPTQARAGSNDSSENDYISGISNELTINLTLKYRLPIGGIKDDPVAVYHLHRGLLESGPQGGEEWNPLTSGQTTFATRFFGTYRDLQDFTIGENDQDAIDELLQARTNGLEFWLEYDNTDFPRNPSLGSRQQLKLTRDFGWGDSSDSWTNVEADLSKYVDFGSSNWFRQKVLALNFWTSNTTTWETDPINPQIISHRPPPNYGSELGGFDRMRAYPSGRFRDKAAVYYTAEFRMIPETQPLRDLPLLNYFEIDWWQLVPFVEAGRVGPEYDSDLFFKDLKWDVGVGLRLMAFRFPVRLDLAYGEEGASVWAMFSQPFSRPGS